MRNSNDLTWILELSVLSVVFLRYDKGSMSMLGYFCTAAIKFCMCISRVAAFLLAATYFSGDISASGWRGVAEFVSDN